MYVEFGRFFKYCNITIQHILFNKIFLNNILSLSFTSDLKLFIDKMLKKIKNQESDGVHQIMYSFFSEIEQLNPIVFYTTSLFRLFCNGYRVLLNYRVNYQINSQQIKLHMYCSKIIGLPRVYLNLHPSLFVKLHYKGSKPFKTILKSIVVKFLPIENILQFNFQELHSSLLNKIKIFPSIYVIVNQKFSSFSTQRNG